jgi:hypothetical protein
MDPGVTIIDDSGKPTLSPKAIKIPSDISKILPSPAAAPPAQGMGINPALIDTPPNINMAASVGHVPGIQNAPSPQPNLPRFSIPSDKYADIESQMPNRQALQPHGMAKVGNILSSIAAGPFAPLLYSALQNVPYQRAEHDWETRLGAIKPEIETENIQRRERGENERAEATRVDTEARNRSTEAHQRAQEDENTQRQKEIDRENIQRDTARKTKSELEAKRIDALATHYKTSDAVVKGNIKNQLLQQLVTAQDPETLAKASEGLRKITEYETQESGAKAGAVAAAQAPFPARTPSPFVNMKGEDASGHPKTIQLRSGENAPPDFFEPGTFEKNKKIEETNNKDIKTAETVVRYANDYIKKNQFDGPHDIALVDQYFQIAQPLRARMTAKQLDSYYAAASLKEKIKRLGSKAATGKVLGEEERQQTVNAINDLYKAKTGKGVDDGASKPKFTIGNFEVK